jgi:hypothetical protein
MPADDHCRRFFQADDSMVIFGFERFTRSVSRDARIGATAVFANNLCSNRDDVGFASRVGPIKPIAAAGRWPAERGTCSCHLVCQGHFLDEKMADQE